MNNNETDTFCLSPRSYKIKQTPYSLKHNSYHSKKRLIICVTTGPYEENFEVKSWKEAYRNKTNSRSITPWKHSRATWNGHKNVNTALLDIKKSTSRLPSLHTHNYLLGMFLKPSICSSPHADTTWHCKLWPLLMNEYARTKLVIISSGCGLISGKKAGPRKNTMGV